MGKTISNAIKLAGEVVAPGASLLMDGKILSGSAHLLVGIWSKVAFGPVGVGLVMANSYATSTTGKNLIKQFTKTGQGGSSEDAATVPPAEENRESAS